MLEEVKSKAAELGRQPPVTQYDYVIVGGGSAGCVLANRLSSRSRNTVALLEAGPDTPPNEVPESIYAEGYLPDYFEPTRYWTALDCYREPIGNRSLEELTKSTKAQRYEQARVMGGGSSINGQVALRGLPSDYDEWECLGVSGWSWQACLPYFKRLERDMDFDGELHGRDGPIPIRRTFPDDWAAFALAFRDALERHGIAFHPDCHATFGDGCFPFPRNNVYGRRVSAAVAYLDSATRQRDNLHIFSDTPVEAIELIDARPSPCWRAARASRYDLKPPRSSLARARYILRPSSCGRESVRPTIFSISASRSWPTGLASGRTCRTIPWSASVFI
jgi:5-(hydroxymethyl)furfural/furfural oxidase